MLEDNGRDDPAIQRRPAGTPWHQTAQFQLPRNLLSLHPVLTGRQQIHDGLFDFHAAKILIFSANSIIFVVMKAFDIKDHLALKVIGIICLVAVLAVAVFFLLEKRRTGKEPRASIGTLVLHHDFPSKYVSPRTVTVWLPDDYKEGEPCEVYYMHDGQMLFDSTTTWNRQEWQVDETMGRLIREHSLTHRSIVVGIDNTPDRLNEYFPDKACQYAEGAKPDNVKGDAYLRFIVEELKPFIDSHYSTYPGREHTYMAGSSMGGLISLYAICEYPDVFGGVICMSSHLSFAYLDVAEDSDALADGFLQYVQEHLPDRDSSRIYMDYGEEGYDAAYAPYQQRMDDLFRREGWEEPHYISRAFPGHDHRESDWAKRLPDALVLVRECPEPSCHPNSPCEY